MRPVVYAALFLLAFYVSALPAEVPGAWFWNAQETGDGPIFFTVGGSLHDTPSRFGDVLLGWTWEEATARVRRYPGSRRGVYLPAEQQPPLASLPGSAGRGPVQWRDDAEDLGLPKMGLGPGGELVFLGHDAASTAAAVEWAHLLDAVEAAWRHSTPELRDGERSGEIEIGWLGGCPVRSLPVGGTEPSWSALDLRGHAVGGSQRGSRRTVRVERFVRWIDAELRRCDGPGQVLRLAAAPESTGFDLPYFLIWHGVEARAVDFFELDSEWPGPGVRRHDRMASRARHEERINMAAWPEPTAAGVDLCQAPFMDELCARDLGARRRLATSGGRMPHMLTACRRALAPLTALDYRLDDPCADAALWDTSVGLYRKGFSGEITLMREPRLVSRLGADGGVEWLWHGSRRRSVPADLRFALADGTRIVLDLPTGTPPVLQAAYEPPSTAERRSPFEPPAMPSAGGASSGGASPEGEPARISETPAAHRQDVAMETAYRENATAEEASDTPLYSTPSTSPEPAVFSTVSPPFESPQGDTDSPSREDPVRESPSAAAPAITAPSTAATPSLISPLVELASAPWIRAAVDDPLLLTGLPGMAFLLGLILWMRRRSRGQPRRRTSYVRRVSTPASPPVAALPAGSGPQQAFDLPLHSKRMRVLAEVASVPLDAGAGEAVDFEPDKPEAVVDIVEVYSKSPESSVGIASAVSSPLEDTLITQPLDLPAAAPRDPHLQLRDEIGALDATAGERLGRAIAALRSLGDWVWRVVPVLRDVEDGRGAVALRSLPPAARREWSEAYDTLRRFADHDTAAFEEIEALLEGECHEPEQLDLYLREAGLVEPGLPVRERFRRHLLSPEGRIPAVVLALQYLIEAFPVEHLEPAVRKTYRGAIRARLEESGLGVPFHPLVVELADALGLSYREIRYYKTVVGEPGYEFLEDACDEISLTERIGYEAGTASRAVVRLESLFLFDRGRGVPYSGLALVDAS